MSFTNRCHPVPTGIIWGSSMGEYFFGDYHPMHPSRLDATARLASDLGIFDLPQVNVEEPEVAGDSVLCLAHDQKYIDEVKAVSANPNSPLKTVGWEPRILRDMRASTRLVRVWLVAVIKPQK